MATATVATLIVAMASVVSVVTVASVMMSRYMMINVSILNSWCIIISLSWIMVIYNGGTVVNYLRCCVVRNNRICMMTMAANINADAKCITRLYCRN